MADVAHNIFLQPLSNYPSPSFFAASNIVNTYFVHQGTKALKVAKLHKKYGPVSLDLLYLYFWMSATLLYYFMLMKVLEVLRVALNELSYIGEEWKGIYNHKENGQLKKFLIPDLFRLHELFSILNNVDMLGKARGSALSSAKVI